MKAASRPSSWTSPTAVKPGAENEILVLVDARTMAGELDNASYFAYFELAGIWQPIEVFATSPAYLSHLAVTTDFDKDYRDAKLSVELDAVNEQAAKGDFVHPLAVARSSRQGSVDLRSDDSSLARSLGAEDVALTDDGQIAAIVECRAAAAL